MSKRKNGEFRTMSDADLRANEKAWREQAGRLHSLAFRAQREISRRDLAAQAKEAKAA